MPGAAAVTGGGIEGGGMPGAAAVTGGGIEGGGMPGGGVSGGGMPGAAAVTGGGIEGGGMSGGGGGMPCVMLDPSETDLGCSSEMFTSDPGATRQHRACHH